MKAYRKHFTKSVHAHFPTQAVQLLAETENHYKNISRDTLFSKTSKNPIDRRLDFCAYFLALIKTLDQQGEGFEAIRTTCLEIVTAYVKPKNKFQAFLKRLPPKVINTRLIGVFLKEFNKKASVNSNPEGFIAKIITDKQETFGLGYGIDILECGICKLFKKHDYEKYASILCEVDEITSALAGLKLIRTGTIANGADKCDFRFKRES